MRRVLDSHSTVIELAPSDLIVGELDCDPPTQSGTHDRLVDGGTVTGALPILGEALERYVLHAEIARGTFGIIFAAHDTRLERDVAIKVLHAELASHPEIAGRFTREASAMARLNHPGILTILDWGDYDGGAFIVMDLLVGETLAMRMARGRLLLPETIEIMKQVTEALQAAHDCGVYHRDLKPENIFLVPDESMPIGVRVKLIDFGLAKELGSTFRTGMLSLFGTPQFMSPEQCRCSSSVDHRTDIYSLGIVLFELATGQLPFDGTIDDLVALHQYTPPPRAAVIGKCPPQLDRLIARMLAKNPDERPQTALEVRDALEAMSLGRLGSSSAIQVPPVVPQSLFQPLPSPSPSLPPASLAPPMFTFDEQFAAPALPMTPPRGSIAAILDPALIPWSHLALLALPCIAIGILAGVLLAG